jgi:hypothetical protein
LLSGDLLNFGSNKRNKRSYLLVVEAILQVEVVRPLEWILRWLEVQVVRPLEWIQLLWVVLLLCLLVAVGWIR